MLALEGREVVFPPWLSFGICPGDGLHILFLGFDVFPTQVHWSLKLLEIQASMCLLLEATTGIYPPRDERSVPGDPRG